jgi:hypothetical protein
LWLNDVFIQGIPVAGQIARLIAFFIGYFVSLFFKNENVKVKVKYGCVLQDPPLFFSTSK